MDRMKYRVMIGSTLASPSPLPDWEYATYARRWRAELAAWIYNVLWGLIAVAYVEEVEP